MADKKCPHCGLINPTSAVRCDCSYDFNAQAVRALDVQGPNGIGGWLIFFAVSLTLIPIVSLVGLIASLVVLLDELFRNSWWAPLVPMFADVLLTLGTLVTTCWLAVLFFTKRAGFPRSWVLVHVVLATVLTVEWMLAMVLSQQFPNQQAFKEWMEGLSRPQFVWIGVWIWSTYLRKSRRVKNTFVR